MNLYQPYCNTIAGFNTHKKGMFQNRHKFLDLKNKKAE